jgi:hypothetical protein
MTLFLRNKNNDTILDLELWVKTEDGKSFVELSSNIDIKNYSYLLINQPDDFKHPDDVVGEISNKQLEIIATFDHLSELRGWLWEVYFMTKQNTPEEYDNILKELRTFLGNIAKEYDLIYVED